MRKYISALGLTSGLLLATAVPASAQSLFIPTGERAVEVNGGWSVGSPSSEGAEGQVGISLDGRWDVGIGFGRYTYDFDDGSDVTFNEYGPFVRYFFVKEKDGAPLSVSAGAQLFFADYPAAGDKGKYVQIGTTVYKSFRLTDNFEVHPFVNFAFVAESYTLDGGSAETDQYLSRDFGLTFTSSTDGPWIWQLTLLEQSFRVENYRGLRVGLVKRF